MNAPANIPQPIVYGDELVTMGGTCHQMEGRFHFSRHRAAVAVAICGAELFVTELTERSEYRGQIRECDGCYN